MIITESVIAKRIKEPFRILRYRIWILIDKIRGVDFTAQVNLNDLKLDSSRSTRYQAVTPRLLRLLKNLRITEEDEFLDLGCGKGKALYFASKMRFRELYGVELSEELLNIARTNFAKLNIYNIELVQMDAGLYSVPDTVTHIFMFNPFPEVVVKEVLRNINESIQRKHRKVTIIYLQPVYSDCFSDYGFAQTLYWKNYCVFSNEI